MIEELSEILNIQETWEAITLQLKALFDPERFPFLESLGLFWNTISDNPVISIFTLLVLVGLPYTLYKATQSSTQADERLDQLVDEMKDFEFEKPLIDLQEKFKNGSFDHSPVIDYDQDILDLNLERPNSSYSIEEDSVLQDLESTSFVKQITLDQDVTDEFLAAGSMVLKSQPDDVNLDLSSLPEDFFDEAEISQPVESRVDEKEPATFNNKDPQTGDDKQDLVFFKKETASPGTDDLQARMEQAIQKLKGKYAPPEEIEGETEPVPQVIEAVKKSSLPEETNIEDAPDEEAALPSTESAPSNSLAGEQKKSLKKSHVITHLNSFQKIFENQLNSTEEQELEKNSDAPQQEQNSSSETILKPIEITRPKKNKTTDEEYQQSLESFLFLKDKKKSE